MPGGDGTGPMGMGPMTGKRAGYCAGYGVPGFMNAIPGRGFGMGFGRGRGSGGGRGWRHWFYATGVPGSIRLGAYAAPLQKPDPEVEKQALKNEADALQSQLDSIKQRLTEIDSSATAK